MSEHRSSGQPLPEWLDGARRRGLLNRLPEATVAKLVQGAHRVAHPVGAVVPAWEDDPWGVVVLRGCLRVYVGSADGGQITLRYVQPGDVIGTFVRRRVGLARSLQTISPSELLYLDAARLAEIARADAAVGWEMLGETARALEETQRAYAIRVFGSLRLRVANAILERASTCGRIAAGMVVDGTQHELAIATGTVREVVASALRDLKRDGIVATRRGGIVIIDPERLVREADGDLGLAKRV